MNAEKPRILMVTPDLPYPYRAGGQMRMVPIVKALASCASVRIACMATSLPAETAAWAQSLGVEIAAVAPVHRGVLRRLRDACGMIVTGRNLVRHAEVQRALDHELVTAHPDVVWLETPYQVRYVLRWGIPVVIDYWGTSEGAFREYRHAAGVRRIRHFVNWVLARNGEAQYARRATAVVTVSQQHADYFRSKTGAREVQVIPIAAPPMMAPTPAALKADPATLIMTGDFSFGPNVDAACWFCAEVLPLVRAGFPAVRIRFAGRNPAPAVRALTADPAVEVTGEVPDLGSLIARAGAYILPLRTGSGFRTKLLEAIALGKPIVTTAIGAEGLDLRNGENCLMVDSPRDFADACLSLLTDPGLGWRLGGAVRKLVEGAYSQENTNQLVAALLSDLYRTAASA